MRLEIAEAVTADRARSLVDQGTAPLQERSAAVLHSVLRFAMPRRPRATQRRKGALHGDAVESIAPDEAGNADLAPASERCGLFARQGRVSVSLFERQLFALRQSVIATAPKRRKNVLQALAADPTALANAIAA